MNGTTEPEPYTDAWFQERSDEELRELCNGDPSSSAHLGAFAEQERREAERTVGRGCLSVIIDLLRHS